MTRGQPGPESGPVRAFCARLRRLQEASGLTQGALAGHVGLGKSQMSQILSSGITRLPDWDRIEAIVSKCVDYAQTKGRVLPEDLREENWRQRYGDVEADVAALGRSRIRARRAPTAEATGTRPGAIEPLPRSGPPGAQLSRISNASGLLGSPDSLGRVIADLDDADAVTFGVHQSIVTESAAVRTLPTYLGRAHDEQLREELRKLAQGERGRRVIILIGGSSTGKTRACWEAVRAELPTWRVWHPLSPERPEALVDALTSRTIAPRTVIWLNETQTYLRPKHSGERAAAVLQQLVHDRGLGPVVVLGSMWPEYWAALTNDASCGHAAARELLRLSRDITVPAEFTAADLTLHATEISKDPRLRLAAEQGGGRLTQHLAGARELVRRYEHAPEAARAVVWAAMDARRLTDWEYVPREFLFRAAPGYLDEQAWDQTGDGDAWFDQALAYLGRPCHGASGPLTRRKSRPGEGDVAVQYKLADYLDQVGRSERAELFPPGLFWDSAAAIEQDPHAVWDLGMRAESRGRYQRAARVYRQAASRGNGFAMYYLADLRKRAGDDVGAEVLYQQAAELGDTNAMRALARMREQAGHPDAALDWTIKAADRGDPFALSNLEMVRLRKGDIRGVDEVVAIRADRGDTQYLLGLAQDRENSGDWAGARAAYQQAADLGDSFALQQLVFNMTVFGDWDGAETIAGEAADRGDCEPLLHLASVRAIAGEYAEAESLYLRAAGCGGTAAIRGLAQVRKDAGDIAGADDLYRQAADHGDIDALIWLAELRRQAGDVAGAEAAYREAASLGRADALSHLGWLKEDLGDLAGASDVYAQAIERGETKAYEYLIKARENAGDKTGAEAAVIQAARHGESKPAEYLTDLRERAGDHSGAETVALQAADRGDSGPLCHLAWLRGWAGDIAGAEMLYRRADDLGASLALLHLAILFEETGNPACAESAYAQAGDRGGAYAWERLALMRERAGNPSGAMIAALQADDYGSDNALLELARLRATTESSDRTETVYWHAIHRGHLEALEEIARIRKESGKRADAANIRRFGLTDKGEIAGGPAADVENTAPE